MYADRAMEWVYKDVMNRGWKTQRPTYNIQIETPSTTSPTA